MMKIYILVWSDWNDETFPLDRARAFFDKEKAKRIAEKYDREYETYVFDLEVEE